MTRDEYIMSLARELSALPEDTRTSALAFYTEMLDDRMEDGLDESSAVAAMERPQDIAARLRAENPGEETQDKEPLNLQDERMAFSTLVDDVLRSVKHLTEDLPREADPEAETAHKAAQKAEAEARAAESGEKNGQYTQMVFHCDAAELRSIRINAREMPVAITAAEGSQATLIYYTAPRDPYTVTLENGVLSLLNDEQSKGIRGFSFSFLADHVRFNWHAVSPTIELALPPQTLADLNVHTSNGSIKLRDQEALCDVQLRTSNSRIALNNVRCKALTLKTSNGRLALENVKAKQQFHGKTSNSRIEGKALRSGGEMILTTSNGRAEVTDASAGQAMRIATSNGSIMVERLSVPALAMKNSNGSIRGLLPGRQEDWAIESGTSNGKNSLPRQQAGLKPLSVFTSNGSIDVRFEDA